MDFIPESKKNHLWRKVIWCTNPEDHPLGPAHYAEIYCCEESNGYSIWYVRHLAKEDHKGLTGTTNADYLLGFYARQSRNEAIERAVLIANSDPSADNIIKALDGLAAIGQKI